MTVMPDSSCQPQCLLARLWVALDRIADMEGQEGMTDHIFAEKALAIANAALGSDSERSGGDHETG